MDWSTSDGETYRPEWVIEGLLARSQRPGYPVDRPRFDVVREWADAVSGLGTMSVICLMDDQQISRYDGIGGNGEGLLDYYRTLGLEVKHIPAEDYKTPPLSATELDAVWEAFRRLPKPTLVHCSAGRDRSGAAVKHILSQLESDHA